MSLSIVGFRGGLLYLHTSWPILVLGKCCLPALRAELEVRSRALAAFSLYQRRPRPILTFEAPMQGVPSSGSELVVDTLVQAWGSLELDRAAEGDHINR